MMASPQNLITSPEYLFTTPSNSEKYRLRVGHQERRKEGRGLAGLLDVELELF
jgi:hypothetical protein